MGSGTQGQLLLFVRLTVGSRDTKMCPRSRFHPRASGSTWSTCLAVWTDGTSPGVLCSETLEKDVSVSGSAEGQGSTWVYCSICCAWVRSRQQLKQHQETNSRCRSLQGHGPAKRVTAQRRWAVEQHSWSCGANGDVERVLGDQQVEEAASSSNPKTWPDRSNSRVRLQSVMVVQQHAQAGESFLHQTTDGLRILKDSNFYGDIVRTFLVKWDIIYA